MLHYDEVNDDEHIVVVPLDTLEVVEDDELVMMCEVLEFNDVLDDTDVTLDLLDEVDDLHLRDCSHHTINIALLELEG